MVHFATLLSGLLSSLMLLISIGGLLLLAANLVAQRRRVDRSLRPIRVLARRSRDRERLSMSQRSGPARLLAHHRLLLRSCFVYWMILIACAISFFCHRSVITGLAIEAEMT